MSDLQSLSLADISALEAQLRAVKKTKQEHENVRYAGMLGDFVEDVVTSGEPVAPTDKSTWTGFKVYGVPLTIDGTQYTVSVTITDVAGKEAAEKAKKPETVKA